MTIRFFDPRKLDGRIGARALVFVVGVLLAQWVAIGTMLGVVWLLAKAAGNVDSSVSCSIVILSSLVFTWMLFSKKGLKTQRRAASSFEKFVSSLLKPRIFNKSAPFNNLHSDTNGSLGLSEGPYPPPPRNNLA